MAHRLNEIPFLRPRRPGRGRGLLPLQRREVRFRLQGIVSDAAAAQFPAHGLFPRQQRGLAAQFFLPGCQSLA